MPDRPDPAPDPAPGHDQLRRLHDALDTTVAQLRAAQEGTRSLQRLHDQVVQRLFAIGLGLQSVAEHENDPELAGRLRAYLADLEQTTDQLRARVLGARPATPGPLTTRRATDAG